MKRRRERAPLAARKSESKHSKRTRTHKCERDSSARARDASPADDVGPKNSPERCACETGLARRSNEPALGSDERACGSSETPHRSEDLARNSSKLAQPPSELAQPSSERTPRLDETLDGRAPSGSARFFLESLGHAFGGGDISLADLVENSADAIMFIDQGDILRYWNRGAEAMFQYDRDEILGRKVGFLLPKDLLESDELGRIQQRITRDGSLSNYVTRRVRKDGEVRWVSLTRSVLHDSQGSVIGSTAVFRDITDQRRTEEELFRSRGLAMVGELSANLAHEIKNRLTGIYAATQVLSRGLSSADPRRAVFEEVGQEIKKLDETAKDLLRFARPIPPKLTPTDVRAFLTRVIQSLERNAEVRKHEIVLEVERDMLANFDGDLMAQVFENLVLNAAQAMEQRGRIVIRAERTNGDVRFAVSDTGPGIPEAAMASLFRPFFTTKSQGTGLGLSIARKNIEMHGGTIAVETELGRGSRFVIRVPISGERASAPKSA